MGLDSENGGNVPQVLQLLLQWKFPRVAQELTHLPLHPVHGGWAVRWGVGFGFCAFCFFFPLLKCSRDHLQYNFENVVLHWELLTPGAEQDLSRAFANNCRSMAFCIMWKRLPLGTAPACDWDGLFGRELLSSGAFGNWLKTTVSTTQILIPTTSYKKGKKTTCSKHRLP